MATLSFTISTAKPVQALQHKQLPCNLIRCCQTPVEPNTLLYKSLAKFPERNPLRSSVTTVPPPRPCRIILVRHGESEGNVDESTYTRVADPKIAITEKGVAEAEECGQRIRDMIEKDNVSDWKVYFYVSPYKRTLQTLQNLAKPFERSRIAGMREEPRLREQDFGNFQDKEKMRVEKETRKRYGRFFYRFPNGESAADVYDRITVEQFEKLQNLGNGGMLVMERGYGGRYSLLLHHSEEELREFGLTDEMLIDQEWQKVARPGELNYGCPMLNSFFPHLNNENCEA